ncbi:DNA repair protein RecO [Patescibacteria group bacterium]|nr:DNA repair protein RecO [Patescibacteria group bacterium]
MAHHIYHTDAIVLGGINMGESHRLISVFTQDVGFVRAVARSVRNEHSKLRFCLQDFSRVQVSLVRGRQVWRITGATEQYNVYHLISNDHEKVVLLTRIKLLLNRLLHGEEKNEYLFDATGALFDALKDNKLSKADLPSLELITVLRILNSLGYLAHDKKFSDYVEDVGLGEELLESVSDIRPQAVSAINHALTASHL